MILYPSHFIGHCGSNRQRWIDPCTLAISLGTADQIVRDELILETIRNNSGAQRWKLKAQSAKRKAQSAKRKAQSSLPFAFGLF